MAASTRRASAWKTQPTAYPFPDRGGRKFLPASDWKPVCGEPGQATNSAMTEPRLWSHSLRTSLGHKPENLFGASVVPHCSGSAFSARSPPPTVCRALFPYKPNCACKSLMLASQPDLHSGNSEPWNLWMWWRRPATFIHSGQNNSYFAGVRNLTGTSCSTASLFANLADVAIEDVPCHHYVSVWITLSPYLKLPAEFFSTFPVPSVLDRIQQACSSGFSLALPAAPGFHRTEGTCMSRIWSNQLGVLLVLTIFRTTWRLWLRLPLVRLK